MVLKMVIAVETTVTTRMALMMELIINLLMRFQVLSAVKISKLVF
jgi:hypothetical protein